MKKLNGLVAIVTGAGEGIGEAIALELSNNGAKIVCVDINKDSGTKTLNKINQNNGEAIFINSDISKPSEVKEMVKIATSKFNSIDILINNAAKFTFGSVEDVTQEQWEEVLRVNVIGYANCAKECLPFLKNSNRSAVVNLASVSSIIAGPKFVPYNTTKGAVLMLTRSLAVDFAEFGIRVNAVCPGSIHTSATYKHIEHMGTHQNV